MKYINKKLSLVMIFAVLVVFSCEDASKAPIVTFDSAGHGAYVRHIGTDAGALLINVQTQSDFDASSFTYSVEFVDEAQGANVAEYVLNVEYVDVNGVNSSGPTELRRFATSDFAPSEAGFMSVSNITITSADVTSKFGLTYTDLSPGDKFIVTGQLVMNNGMSFTSENSSATVNGTAFQGFFDFTLPAACPSNLEGTYNITGTDFCGGGGVTGTVDIVALGGGSYSFSDWSFGSYGICYGGGSASGDFTFVDVCKVVTINDGTDSFGDSWTFSSVISGNDWVITWLNFTYNNGVENGVVNINFPGGVPFTLN